MTTQQATLPGFALKEAALDSLERQAFVSEARWLAEQLCHERGAVTTDDLQALLRLPAECHVNTWGAILRPPLFRLVNYKPSRRREAHARRIGVWVLGPGKG